jgi:hypothetical protein
MSNKEKGGFDQSGHDNHEHGEARQENQRTPVEPRLEPLLQAHIGKQLRDMFETMAREPVPDRFKSLLDRLEAGEEIAAASVQQADDEAEAK